MMCRYRGLVLHDGKHTFAPVWVTGTLGRSAGAYPVAQMPAGAAVRVTITAGLGARGRAACTARGKRCLREGAARVLPRATAQTRCRRDGERLTGRQDRGLHQACPGLCLQRAGREGVALDWVWGQECSRSHQTGLLHPAQQGPPAAQGSQGLLSQPESSHQGHRKAFSSWQGEVIFSLL